MTQPYNDINNWAYVIYSKYEGQKLKSKGLYDNLQCYRLKDKPHICKKLIPVIIDSIFLMIYQNYINIIMV